MSWMRCGIGLTREKMGEMRFEGAIRRSKRRRRQIKEIKIFRLKTVITTSSTMNSFNMRNFVSEIDLARTKSAEHEKQVKQELPSITLGSKRKGREKGIELSCRIGNGKSRG